MPTDEKYSFIVEEGGNRQVFYFAKDGNGNPIKLGDGTYGVVYKVFNMVEDELAVKIFYDNKAPSRISQPFLTEEIIHSFCNRFKIPTDDSLVDKLRKLDDPSDKLGTFAVKLQSLKLTDKQYGFLLSSIHQESESIAHQRYKHEMEAPREIRKKLRERGLPFAFAGVIDNFGGTEKFRSSNAYQNLRDKFEESRIKVSDYAIVMPLYEWTLKDLLQEGIQKYTLRLSSKNDLFGADSPTNQKVQELAREEFSSEQAIIDEVDKIEGLSHGIKANLKNNIIELSGYNLLQSMDFEKRISTILPFLLDIGQGLMAIHGAQKYHYDLKPSNIFVRRLGGNVDAVIGDLGFMMIPYIYSTETTTIKEVLPLGTRHYRSPEQKDFFDICDVEISHNIVENAVALIVNDPKFKDSIIEPGDFIRFSKDASTTRYYIESIEKSPGTTIITLKGKEKLKELLKPDKRTQVIFYKEQAVRTDLFGFGAIVFDLITGGKSPERFYDNIRIYDTEDQDVIKIMELYGLVSTYQAHEPGLSNVFSPFKHEHGPNYAPAEVVELILRCMFYKANNTFYRSYISSSKALADNYKAMAALFDKLKALDIKFRSDRLNNILITHETTPTESLLSTMLDKRIYDLQLKIQKNMAMRFAHGFWYFKKLVERVRETIEVDNIYFCEMLPQNIIVNPKNLEFAFIAYKTEDNFKTDLKNDHVYARINRDITNPYIPNYMGFMRRKIQLKPVPQKKNIFSYVFSSSAIVADQITIGDWIIIDSGLWKISSISDGEIALEPDVKQSSQNLELIFKDKEDQFSEFVYYKNINSCSYYLNMLGIYLYHIFFLGLGNTTKDKPTLITIAQIANTMHNNHQAVRIKERKIESSDKLDKILQFIAQMYLKLCFPEIKNSYFQNFDTDEKRILQVSQDIGKLKYMIASFLEEEMPDRLDTLISEYDEQKKQHIFEKIQKYPVEKLTFDNIVRSFIKISLQKKRSYYHEWNEKFQNKLDAIFKKGQKSSKQWIIEFSKWGITQLEKGRLKLGYTLSILFVILILIAGTVLLISKSINKQNSEDNKSKIKITSVDSTKVDSTKTIHGKESQEKPHQKKAKTTH